MVETDKQKRGDAGQLPEGAQDGDVVRTYRIDHREHEQRQGSLTA